MLEITKQKKVCNHCSATLRTIGRGTENYEMGSCMPDPKDRGWTHTKQTVHDEAEGEEEENYHDAHILRTAMV